MTIFGLPLHKILLLLLALGAAEVFMSYVRENTTDKYTKSVRRKVGL